MVLARVFCLVLSGACKFVQDFVGCGDTSVLGFFEDRESAQVGIGEENAAVRSREIPSFAREDRAHLRARHGVA